MDTRLRPPPRTGRTPNGSFPLWSTPQGNGQRSNVAATHSRRARPAAGIALRLDFSPDSGPELHSAGVLTLGQVCTTVAVR